MNQMFKDELENDLHAPLAEDGMWELGGEQQTILLMQCCWFRNQKFPKNLPKLAFTAS